MREARDEAGPKPHVIDHFCRGPGVFKRGDRAIVRSLFKGLRQARDDFGHTFLQDIAHVLREVGNLCGQFDDQAPVFEVGADLFFPPLFEIGQNRDRASMSGCASDAFRRVL